MDRLNRKEVKDAAFPVVLRGYDKRQVDERLRFLGSQLTAAENALRAANQRIATLEDAPSEARSAPGGEPPGDSNFGARVEKILMLAQDEAREVHRQAEAAAAALVEQARAQAAEQQQRAEHEIAAWRAEANERAAEQDSALRRRSAELDSARQEVEKLRPDAERESERIRAQARTEADEIRKTVAAEADQIRKAVAAEADELFSAAAAEADRVVKLSRAEADQVIAQARAEAERLVAAATDAAQQRERSSAHELNQLSRLHDEINADLYHAKEVLDGLFAHGDESIFGRARLSRSSGSALAPGLSRESRTTPVPSAPHPTWPSS